MRIVIGTDGTAGSLGAVRLIGRMFAADPSNDPIFMYYAPPHAAVSATETSVAPTAHRLHEVMIDSIYQRSRHELPESLRERTQRIEGTQHAKHGLLVAADEHRVDLIAVGSHSLTTRERWMVGSVSRAVTHAATIPVLVARSPAESVLDRPLRVLVACDRTEASHGVQQFISRIPWPSSTQGQIVSVFESIVGEIPTWLEETLARESGGTAGRPWDLFAEDKSRALHELTTWCQELPAPFRAKPPELLVGQAATTLIERASHGNYDLIIVGARHHRAIGRWLLGGTSDAILNHAPCSVLVARAHERP